MRESKISSNRRAALRSEAMAGCEASLFEFSEKQSHEPHVVRIAAIKLDEALACLRWHKPDFEIESVQSLEIILMVSGSPVD